MTSDRAVFRCRRCGNCCRRSGEVVVTPEEAEDISRFLGIDFEDFMEHDVRLSSDRRQLVLAGEEDGPCVFLTDGNVCAINDVKPRQCRDFPEKWNYPGWQSECGMK